VALLACPAVKAIRNQKQSMIHQITITTGARLHFGFLENGTNCSRQFGGAGVMVDSPGYRVVVSVDKNDVEASTSAVLQSAQARAQRFRQTYRENAPSEFCDILSRCNVNVLTAIPAHSGLGSGTQLGLAVATGLSLLCGEPTVDATTLATRVGRGKRSALGIHGFERGGFLIDGGKQGDHEIGQLLERIDFPADWRFLLVTPPNPGLSGQAELDAFASLEPMSERTTSELREILMDSLLPAVQKVDFKTCSESLYEFGQIVGNYFAPIQGGTMACARMAELVSEFQSRGLTGLGQTSWGPTLFALCENLERAESLCAEFSTEERWSDCTFRIAAPLNSGAEIEVRSIS